MAAKRVGAGRLLASALSARMESPVLTYDQYLQKKDSGVEFQELGISQIFGFSPLPGDNCPICGKQGRCTIRKADASFQLFVKTEKGRTITIDAMGEDSVEELKLKIESANGFPSVHQRLMYNGRQLEDGRRLSDYRIGPQSTLFLLSRLHGGGSTVSFYIKDHELLDPQYDYDFRKERDDGKEYYRGGMEYYRPYGWERFALKVLGEYEDDEWLGKGGIRTASSPNEWPVSYHGTNPLVAENIARKGFDRTKGKRSKFGDGIYSTPSILVAERYAETFPHGGKTFKLVYQNRVSVEGLEIIPREDTGDLAEYWLQPNDRLIRPYGLCFKSISSCSIS